MISGFRATDIGQYGIEDFSFWEPSGIPAASPFDVGGGESPFWTTPFDDVLRTILDAVGRYSPPSPSVYVVPSGASIPQEPVRVIGTPQGVLIPESAYDETVVPSPEVEEEVVPHPTASPSIFDEIPDYEPYVEQEVAIDWGDLLTGVVDVAAGVYSGQTQRDYVSNLFAGPTTGAPAMPGVTPPRTVTVDTVTGKITPCRRRRRRRLLTNSDLSDLAALKTIVGGGAAMNSAVMKAVRR